MYPQATILLLASTLASLGGAVPSFLDTHDATSPAKRGWSNYGDHPGSTSSYTDGEGTYVESGDWQGKQWAWSENCWTDLFWVKSAVVAKNWVRDEASVDCATTSSCELRNVKSGERCKSWSNGFSISFSAGTESFKKFMALAGEVSYEHVEAGEECTVSESQNACYWEDKLCHQAWRSDLVVQHHGYIRRRCGKNKHDHTVWMKDWDYDVPIKETRLGCAALCGDQSYPTAQTPPIRRSLE